MYARALVLSLLALSLARVQTASDDCTDKYTYSHNNTAVNITRDCKEKACITKCCPDNEIYIDGYSPSCVNFTYLEETFNTSIKPDYSSVEIFNSDIKERDAIIAKKFFGDFVILYNELLLYDDCSTILYNDLFGDSEKWYILEDGSLVRRALNYANQWFETYSTGQFCLDLQLKYEMGTLVSKDPEIIIMLLKMDNNVTVEDKTRTRALLSSYGLLVSCVFMVLVLLVYALLAELRSLMGLMLMAYMVATTAFFLLRSTHVLAAEARVLNQNACTVITLLVYYSMLSSFSWLNVMSFDIWWTLRRTLPVDVNGRTGRKGRRLVPKKFWWYNVYGWGLPLILALFVIVVDIVDLRHLPNFIKPHVINGIGCSYDADEHKLYVSIPLLILILASFVMFVMTAFGIWRVRRGVNAFGTSTNDTGFKVYAKISLLMGITWVSEALSNVVLEDSWVWYITDVYNIFVGFFLFLAFVCKKEVFLSLCKKFSIDNALVRKLRARDPESSCATSHRRSTHSTICATSSVDVTNACPAGDNEQHKKT